MNQSNSIEWLLNNHSVGDYINEAFVGVVTSSNRTRTKASNQPMTIMEVADTSNPVASISWTLFDHVHLEAGDEVAFFPARGKGKWIKLDEYNGLKQLKVADNARWNTPGSAQGERPGAMASTASAGVDLDGLRQRIDRLTADLRGVSDDLGKLIPPPESKQMDINCDDDEDVPF